MKNGDVVANIAIRTTPSIARKYGLETSPTDADIVRAGHQILRGYMIRYLYPLNPSVIDRLTVEVLPFSKIDELGASMYRGKTGG